MFPSWRVRTGGIAVCSFLWKGVTNCLRLIAVFLLRHQLQKQVDPRTLRLAPAGVSAISAEGNKAAPTGAQG